MGIDKKNCEFNKKKLKIIDQCKKYLNIYKKKHQCPLNIQLKFCLNVKCWRMVEY